MDIDIHEIGIDSIILMQVLRKLKVMNCDIDFESLYSCKTFNDILAVANNSIDHTQKHAVDKTAKK